MFRRQLPLAALLALGLVLGACADSPTAPKNECTVTQGSHDCVK